MTPSRRIALFALALTLLVSTVFVGAASAEGPGTGGRRIRLENERVGPYVLRVVTSPNPPQVETLYVEVRVEEATSGRIVRNAEVNLTAHAVDSGASLEAEATHDIAPIPSDYAGHLGVPHSGDWIITVEVKGPAGQAEVSFQEYVVSQSRLAPILSAALPFAGLLILIAVFLMFQSKGDEPEQHQNPPPAPQALPTNSSNPE